MEQLGWVVLALISAIGAAGVAIFGRIGLESVDSTLATTLRSLVMAATMLAVAFSTGKLQPLMSGSAQLDRRAWLFILLSGGAGALSWLAYFGALRTGPASGVAAIDRLSVAFVFVIAVLALGEQHSWRGWLGLVLLLGGVYLIAADK